MKRTTIAVALVAVSFCLALSQSPRPAAAHCDTLDGPVIRDARMALEKGDITPVLKWVRQQDEPRIRKAFKQTLATGGKDAKAKQAGERRFFEALVKIHRAGEGAPFTGLKPAGEVEPVIAAADSALAGGSADELDRLVADTVSRGIRERHRRVVELQRHKDESVEAGRKFVAAYVEYTHYVERVQQAAEGHAAHHHEGAAAESQKRGHAH